MDVSNHVVIMQPRKKMKDQIISWEAAIESTSVRGGEKKLYMLAFT